MDFDRLRNRLTTRIPTGAEGAFFMGSALGALVFVLIWGFTPLNPANFEWLANPFGGDLTFSAISALAFQREGWTFPIGLIESIVYPAHTSIVLADNVPLVAIAFKALAKLLGRDTQYYGIWGFVCTILQGGIASAILFKYCRNIFLSLLGTLFFLFSPIFLGRMFVHISMGGQWVILLPMLVIAYRDEILVRRYEIALCSLMCIVSAGILAYFTPMVLMLVVLYYWLRVENGWKTALAHLLVTLGIAIPGILLLMWVCGGFLPNMVSGGAAYGAIPLNLAAYIDPGPFSRLFPGFAVGPTENFHWESYAWLGMGIMTGAAVLLIGAVLEKQLHVNSFWKVTFPFLITGLVLVGFAATNVLRFGDQVIFTYPLTDELLSLFSSFRSSARIGWPVWYLLAFLIIGGLASLRAGVFIKTTLLLSLLGFQIWDGWAFSAVPKRPDAPMQSPKLSDPLWQRLSAAGKHLYILPFWGFLRHDVSAEIYLNSVRHGVTTNVFWLGRYPMDEMSASINKKVVDLRAGIWVEDDIFLMNHVPYLAGVKLPPGTDAYLVDGLAMVARSGLNVSIEGVKRASLVSANLGDYLASLDNISPSAVIVLGGRSSPVSSKVDAKASAALEKLGLTKLSKLPSSFAYSAVIHGKKVVSEVLRPATIYSKFHFRSSDDYSSPVDVDMTITPGGGGVDGMAVNGTNVMGAIFGLNIAVFDLERKKIVQQAAFDTYSQEPGVVLTPD